ncbi:hypothetical protein TrLO_g14935 [Triparma laevis f. longispina]|uniref:protein-disulfide reductase n=1 Tax=Triparma laevis f. longispina TaxID=1714387 RepID=A0A9W7FP09_9STRA|nr:hypothetical protein TrLO_g14935 [Triparma laevis f. longispina]
MVDDLESCPVVPTGPPQPLEIDETSALNPSSATPKVELRGILNLLSGSISAPSSLSPTTVTHYAMPSREYVCTKQFICLYFSAAWCPPCRKFSPVLSKWANENEDDVGVIFVSHDTSEKEMLGFVANKNFAYMPFRDKTFSALNQLLSVSMLPTLVIVNRADGKVITHWGRTCVEKNGEGCVGEWKEGGSGVSWLQTFCSIS